MNKLIIFGICGILFFNFVNLSDRVYADSEPICTAGTFNPSTDVCEVGDPFCSPGTYETSIDKCVTLSISPTCLLGSFNPASDKCEATSAPFCSLGTYNTILNQCVFGATPPNCGGGTLNTGTEKCEKPPVVIFGSTTCVDVFPLDFTLVGGICVADPSCTLGTYNSVLNQCVLSTSSASCLSGTLNTGTDQCESFSDPTCTLGTFNAIADKCLSGISDAICSVGTLNTSSDKCEEPFSCAPGTQFDTNENLCLSSANNQVIGGYLLPIDTTSLILAGAQFSTMLIPIAFSIVGIGLILVRKRVRN